MKISFLTLGCRLNQYETQLLREMAEDTAHALVHYDDDPDLIIVNACSVTMNAVQQTRNLVRRSRRASPDATIILTGCFPDEIAAALPEAHRFIPNERKFEFFGQLFPSKREHISRFSRHTRALVKIQTGCNHFCTYCIVPYLRGKERSRPVQEIHREIVSLVQNGFSEITLTGIHIGRYHSDDCDLVGLLRSMEAIPGLKRVRLSSLNPEEVSDRLIEVLSSSDMFCHHLHISLQTGDRDILHAMGRDYQIENLTRTLRLLTSRVPDFGIGADIITGFPGETELKFQTTFDFISHMPFTYLHVFRYSPRRNTLAALISQKVPEQEKRRRSSLLRQLGLRKSIEFRNRYLGKNLKVLIESKRDKHTNLMVGFSGNYIRVLVQERKNVAETFQDVKIERIEAYDTYGTICQNTGSTE
jgi:threonylcarbamoyladenosine tRNA methylthiotransferase MtaB